MKVKRFVVFGFDAHYPGGGMNDFHSSHDTFEEAEAAAAETRTDFNEIVDLENFEPES